MKIVRINIDGTMNDLDITLKKKNILKILEEKSSSKGNTNFASLNKALGHFNIDTSKSGDSF